MAIRLDGIGNGTNNVTKTTGLPQVSPFSICFWGLILSDRNTYTAFVSRNNGAQQSLYIGTFSDGTRLELYVGVAERFTTDPVNYNIPLKEWHHYGYVRASATSHKLFYDGRVVINVADNAPTHNTRFNLAYDQASASSNIDGAMLEVRMWEAALNDTEIIQDMLSPFEPSRRANLFAWLDFNDLKTGYLDKSGRGNHWTVNGTIPGMWHNPGRITSHPDWPAPRRRAKAPAAPPPPAVRHMLPLLGVGA